MDRSTKPIRLDGRSRITTCSYCDASSILIPCWERTRALGHNSVTPPRSLNSELLLALQHAEGCKQLLPVAGEVSVSIRARVRQIDLQVDDDPASVQHQHPVRHHD